MGKTAQAFVLVLAIFFLVAFIVYGAFSALTGLRPPGDAPPLVFLGSVLVVKAGHAAAFVLLFHLGRDAFAERWLTYAFIWWLMFVIGEIGQAIGETYSSEDAIAGVISETIYFPLAAFVTQRLVGAR
jgi:hypothetical protein